jgi:hypothetical protein
VPETRSSPRVYSRKELLQNPITTAFGPTVAIRPSGTSTKGICGFRAHCRIQSRVDFRRQHGLLLVVVGDVAARRVVDGPALLAHEDSDVTVLVASAGDLDLIESLLARSHSR